MRFLVLALLAALPLSAHPRFVRRAGFGLPRPVVVIRPGAPACGPALGFLATAPLVHAGHWHRWHAHRRHRHAGCACR